MGNKAIPCVGNDSGSGLPANVQSLLLPGKILAVVGLNDGDISYAHREIQALLESRHDSSLGKISVLHRTIQLFPHSSVQENIFMQSSFPFQIRRKALFTACSKLFSRFQISIDPLASVSDLDTDDMRIVELLRAYVQRPKYLFLYDTLSFFGYIYTNVFRRIIDQFLFDGCTVVYLSTKWEDALNIGDNFAIVYRERFMQYVCSAEEVRVNPRQLVYLLSGIEIDHDKQDESDFSLDALNCLYNSSKLFIRNNELTQSLNHMITAIQSNLNSDGCTLYIKDEFGSIYPFSGDDAEPSTYALRDTFINMFIEYEMDVQHLHVGASENNDIFNTTDNGIEYMVIIPIRTRTHNFGILQLVFKDSVVFSERQMLTLNTFCNEISIIIETSRLINQSVLLRETNHRIKNNLQIIIGMLYTQQEKLQLNHYDKVMSDILENTIMRIKSIALIHDLLTANANGGEIISIDRLFEALIRFYEHKGAEGMTITKSIEPFYIVYNQATSICMIMNELINNCVKHAFRDQEVKIINVSCRSIDSDIEIRISDNGRGFPKDFDISACKSVGMSIVQNLVKASNGKITISNDRGSSVAIVLPKAKFCRSFVG